jgi:hypothetical protein
MPFLRDKYDTNKILTFKRGHDVGTYAQQLFPNGTDVSLISKNLDESLQLTSVLIAEKKTIYEAAFLYNGVLILVDILAYENNVWNAYEVKSSLKVSSVYLLDACLQSYVLKGSLSDFNELFLVTLNGDYELKDQVDIKKLFKKRSVKKEAEKNTEYFDSRISLAKELLEKNTIPDIPIGAQCTRPYTCDYFRTCWKDVLVEKSIFELPNIGREKLFEWQKAGIKSVEQIPDQELNSTLLKVKNSFKNNLPVIDKNAIAAFISEVKLPCAAMDMEIWSSAIPQLNGTKPFQQIPFLFTLYNGTEKNYFFAPYQTDERKEFAQKLVEYCEPYATILVYDKSMENQAIISLSEKFPDLSAKLSELKEKMKDVSDIFKFMHFYHPQFKNNFSLKAIAAVLAPEVEFDKISGGLEAMNYFNTFRQETNELEKQIIKDELVSYCMNDSVSTFKLYEYLRTLVQP